MAQKISRYIAELKGVQEKKLTSIIERAHGQTGVMEGITVQFDAAFDKRNSRSASGLVVRDQMGALKASKTVLHENIPSLVGKMMIHRAIDLEGRWREN